MKNKKAQWDEQDDAFFGFGSSSPSTTTHVPSDVSSTRRERNGINSSTRTSSSHGRNTSRNANRNTNATSSDEELAMKLQQELLMNQAEADKLALEKDMEFARRLQMAGSDVSSVNSNNMGSWNQNRNRNRNRNRVDQRRQQEDEDAALARALMEEEERNQRTNTPSPTSGDGWNGGGISQYPGMRRNEHGGRRQPQTQPQPQPQPHPQQRPSNSNSMFGRWNPFIPRHIECKVCKNPIPADSFGRVSYIRHPFFEKEVMCPHHQGDRSVRKCTGCNRYEPQVGGGFVDLGDDNRCVCDSCLRTVIVDSEDAKPLWGNVLQFFERGLKLPVWNAMRDIPILIVGHDALNDQMRGGHTHAGHGGWSEQIMTTRGLCLTEHHVGFNFLLPRMRFNQSMSSFMPSASNAEAVGSARTGAGTGHTYFKIPDASKSNPNTAVTAILCLSGLPSDLTASILAHEACHAWFKLNPDFHISKPIPPQVEEGCCQLIAMLFLNDGLPDVSRDSNTNGYGDGNNGHGHDDDGSPTNQKLRQYFKFSIESAGDEIYGEGYRLAAKAYAKIGIEALLSHVVNYQEFPTI